MTWNPTEAMKRADLLLAQFRSECVTAGHATVAPMMEGRLFELVAKAIDDGLAHGGLTVKQDQLPLDDAWLNEVPHMGNGALPAERVNALAEGLAASLEQTTIVAGAKVFGFDPANPEEQSPVPVAEAPARKKAGRPKGAKYAKKAKGKPGRPKKDRSGPEATVSATEAPVAAVSEAPVELPTVAAPEPSTEAQPNA